jgi:hypothetical protein
MVFLEKRQGTKFRFCRRMRPLCGFSTGRRLVLYACRVIPNRRHGTNALTLPDAPTIGPRQLSLYRLNEAPLDLRG